MFSTAGSKGLRPATIAKRAARLQRRAQLQCRYQSSHTNAASSSSYRPWIASSTLAAGAAATYLYTSSTSNQLHAEALPAPAELTFEKTKKKLNATKEDIRDSISSQHVQVKKSWENPGVYAWGSNANRVANPDSDESIIRSPRRIAYFDGMLLRDIKLDRYHGAAIDEKGNLIQWGKGYSETEFTPRVTFKGKDLISICTSRDRIVALSASGKIYSIPASKADQDGGKKPLQSTWIPFYKSQSPISYRRLRPELGWGEKITSVAGGLEHVLLLSNSGRVFAAASSTEYFPARGQMGIPGLTWTTRPKGPYDMCHEITALGNTPITKIAAGDYHSLALSKDGQIYSFGDNTSGQLGFEISSENLWFDHPLSINLGKLYPQTSVIAKATDIAAGGSNTFFSVDAVPRSANNLSSPPSTSRRQSPKISVDTWSCGLGIMGNLGTGKWLHHSGTPTKLAALSGMSEYSDALNSIVPIRLERISVGSTHTAAVMSNVTNTTPTKSSDTDATTLYGADVLFWGGNEFYQLGNGKRNNVATPVYIPPLDAIAGAADSGKTKLERKEERETRFQITPAQRVKVKGRTVDLKQEVECGRYVTAVYSKV